MTYFKKLFLLTALLLILPIVFTFIVDPYSLTNLNILNFKEKGIFDYRTNKYYLIEKNHQYEAFIIGSSRATQLQPAVFKAITGYETFNYAVLTGMPEDYLAIVQHIIAKKQPKMIWLHLDFFALNENMPVSPELYRSPLNSYLKSNHTAIKKNTALPWKIYFSYTGFKDAFSVAKKNIQCKAQPHMQQNGEGIPNTENFSPQVKLLESYWDKEYKNYTLSFNRINNLKAIKKLCDDNRIKLYVSLSPVHNSHYDKLKQTPNIYQKIPVVKKNLCTIFGSYYDFFIPQHHPYLLESRYWQDSVHPTTPLGETISTIMANYIIQSNHNLSFGTIQCTTP